MKPAKLVVDLTEEGKVYVTGQLQNKDLCIAMLEEAIKAVKNFKPSLIIPPTKEQLKTFKEN